MCICVYDDEMKLILYYPKFRVNMFELFGTIHRSFNIITMRTFCFKIRRGSGEF